MVRTLLAVFLITMSQRGEGARVNFAKALDHLEQQHDSATLSQIAEVSLTVATECIGSKPQLCRMLCPPLKCPATHCVMRKDSCCDLECQPKAEEKHQKKEASVSTVPPLTTRASSNTTTLPSKASSTLDGTLQNKWFAAKPLPVSCVKVNFSLTLDGDPHKFSLDSGHEGEKKSKSCDGFEDSSHGSVEFECKDEGWKYVSHSCKKFAGTHCGRTTFTLNGPDKKDVTLLLDASEPGPVDASCADGFDKDSGKKIVGKVGVVHFQCNKDGNWQRLSGFCHK